jgi:hypothetical protein
VLQAGVLTSNEASNTWLSQRMHDIACMQKVNGKGGRCFAVQLTASLGLPVQGM